MRSFEQHRALIDDRIGGWCAALPEEPLYVPMRHLLGLPAKRVRPALVLMSCELFGGPVEEALDEAVGIELFHNFTLMHDDIMDDAPLRRGQPSVHAKWGVNAAILSGDALLVKAYQLMVRNREVLDLFSRAALLVCEGQQRDMDLEHDDWVGSPHYVEMIRRKTAALLSCAVQVGAVIAGASPGDRDRIGAYGGHIGLAFQLRDDLLDAFGDMEKVGKQRGGDLQAGKRTWLVIRALEKEREAGASGLKEQLARPAGERDVPRMLGFLDDLGVQREVEQEIMRHDAEAARALDAIAVPDERKAALRSLAAVLLERAH